MANIELNLPSSAGNPDLQKATKTSYVVGDKSDVNTLVNQVNQYLRFTLWVVAMAVLVIAWYKLITAHGDEKEMKKANNMLIGLVVWILIAIFSYLLVRIVANLF